MTDHVASKKLSRLLSEGSTSKERQRLLDHFGRGCSDCWRNLTDLARSWAVAAVDAEDPVAVPPVVQSLERCRGFLAPRFPAARPTPSTPRDADLRPIHRHVLAQACCEEARVAKALAFRRLVLEECRHQALQAPSALIKGLRWALDRLPDEELRRHAPHRTRALEAEEVPLAR